MTSRTGSSGSPAERGALARAALGLVLLLAVACGGEAPGAASVPSGVQILGRRGDSPGSFSYPRAIDIASNGELAVIDKTGRVQLLTPDGHPILDWLLPRYDKGTPTGIVYDLSDPTTRTLVVADTHYSRILRYSLGGRLLLQFGDYGDQPGQMIYPTDVAIDPQGQLFISEYGKNDRIEVFSGDGKFIRQFGGFGSDPGQFQRPMAVAWDPAGRLVVADTCNHRLQVFKPDGELIAVWGSAGDGPGQFNYPYDVAVAPNGDVFVLEYGNNRLQWLDRDGKVKAVYGGPGLEPGKFAGAWGVALAPDGRLFIADTDNHRLQAIEPKALEAGKTKSQNAAAPADPPAKPI